VAKKETVHSEQWTGGNKVSHDELPLWCTGAKPYAAHVEVCKDRYARPCGMGKISFVQCSQTAVAAFLSLVVSASVEHALTDVVSVLPQRSGIIRTL